MSKCEVFLGEEREDGDDEGGEDFGRGREESKRIDEEFEEDVVEENVHDVNRHVPPDLCVSV